MNKTTWRFGVSALALLVSAFGVSAMTGCEMVAEPGGEESEAESVGSVSQNLDTVIFQDDFNTFDIANNWNIQTSADGHACTSAGTPFNNERQAYTANANCANNDHNICVNNGTLKIVVRKQTATGCNNTSQPYTSGRLNTEGKQEFHPWLGTNGIRIEYRVRMPRMMAGGVAGAPTGTWPAAWTLGENLKQWPFTGNENDDWPNAGEMDIAEVGSAWGNGANTLATLHDSPGTYSAYDGDNHRQTSIGQVGIGDYQWHTYYEDWTPTTIKMYMDGAQIGGTVDLTTMPNQDFNHGHFLVLNMAMGGAGGGNVMGADTWFPSNGQAYYWEQVMEVDYVKVTALGGVRYDANNVVRPGIYEIKNWNSRSMNIAGGTASWSPDQRVIQYDYSATSKNHREGLFLVQDVGGSPTNYIIQPLSGVNAVGGDHNLCLNIAGHSTADGGSLIQYPCNDGAGNVDYNMKFNIVDTGGGYFNIKPAYNGKCIDVPGGDTNPGTNGAQLQQWACNASPNQDQRWQFIARSAVGQIEGEAYNGVSGVGLEACSEGGQDLMDVGNNDYTYYNSVNFGGVKQFQARVASANYSGFIDFRVGSPTGTLLGTCYAPNTGGWQSWQTVTCPATATASGTGTLYTVFRGAGATNQNPNVNWISVN